MQLNVAYVGESRMWDGCVGIVLGFDTKTWGTDPAKGSFFKGFTLLPAGNAHGTTASGLAISFASLLV
jgi:hypothetical protein